MTAEVAIMNPHALVMAADSASTVTMWVRGERYIRYFKGANKLFQLSAHHPVGLMIYHSALLHDVPWELLVKDFRVHLGKDSCGRLEGYSQRFFEFIESHTTLFPDDVRTELFWEHVAQAALGIGYQIAAQEGVRGNAGTALAAAFGNALELLLTELKSTTPATPISTAEVESTVATHARSAASEIANDHLQFQLPDRRLAPVLAEAAIRSLMTDYKRHLLKTGVVIAGYGDDDYYPGIEAFECYGFLDRRFICSPSDKPATINGDLPATIKSFATNSMINTFRTGFGPDMPAKVAAATEEELRDFAGKIQQALAPDREIANLDRLIREALESHTGRWLRQSAADHSEPLAAVIEALPVADMAALAKSLIELQSLKERVTRPTESVSGPVDVAAISKHDGFVWIERKHYFEPELNPRFFVRQAGCGQVREDSI